MYEDNRHAGNVILLRVACLSLLIALVLAWCLVGTHALKLPAALEFFQYPDKLLSSHLDYLMMTMLLLGIYAAKVPLAIWILWPMAIGSITNPLVFLLQSFPLFFPGMELFIFVSITLTTFGYGMAAIKLARSTLL
ncbi:MAG: hypothetical protein ACR2P9_07765 [Gammaproteobacteria bacterium]